MARTPDSLSREAEQRDSIPVIQRQARFAHLFRAGSFLSATGLIIDDLTNGGVTKALDKGILYRLDLNIGTGNLNATRLSAAGLYVAAGAVHLVRETRRRNQITSIELMANQEAQSDRLATAIELNSGQLSEENIILGEAEVFPNPGN
jgi:hypothetical protein